MINVKNKTFFYFFDAGWIWKSKEEYFLFYLFILL